MDEPKYKRVLLKISGEEMCIRDSIKAIHFDELKVPSMPFQLPTARYYYGLGEMMDLSLIHILHGLFGAYYNSEEMREKFPHT